jgi:hypothetical protein
LPIFKSFPFATSPLWCDLPLKPRALEPLFSLFR